MANSLTKFTYLTETIPFIPPKYWVEPRLDLRGRLIDYTLKCSEGVHISGYETEADAIETARLCGIRVSNKPEILLDR